MADSTELFEVWCVVSDLGVVKFGSGPRDNPWSPIYFVFPTEEEAIDYSSGRGTEPPKNGLWPRDRRGEVPIAWLVTFIILSNESGEATYGIQPCFAGAVSWNDDRDVMAIFPTEALAKEYVAAKQ